MKAIKTIMIMTGIAFIGAGTGFMIFGFLSTVAGSTLQSDIYLMVMATSVTSIVSGVGLISVGNVVEKEIEKREKSRILANEVTTRGIIKEMIAEEKKD